MGRSSSVPAKTGYEALLAASLGITRKYHCAQLDMYWELGERVKELMENASNTYGSKTVKTLADDLTTAGFEVGEKTLYTMAAFRTHMTKEQITVAKASAVPLRTLLALCNSKIDEETRTKLLKEAAETGAGREVIMKRLAEETGSDDSDEDETDEDDKKTKKDKTAPTNTDDDLIDMSDSLRTLRGFRDMLNQLTQNIPKYSDDVNSICKGHDEKAIAACRKLYTEIVDAFSELTGKFDEQSAKCVSAFKRLGEQK